MQPILWNKGRKCTPLLPLLWRRHNRETDVGEIDDQVLVDLNMTNFPQGVPQPAHIHAGACPDVGDIIFPLNNVVNGKSRTILDTSLEYLRSLEPLAINVHKSVPESEIYVSCGDLVL